ncbi:MAG: DUF1786 domain-containing protein [Chloroflexota bacterium]|nr:MAG: DUF1786 domain-containing protein [Chloroflexota bacterium]
MKILTVDVGTGTQDIYLYDSRLDIENGFKLVVPSPTMIVRKQLQEATLKREPVLLTGVLMGGGPSHWAAEDHLREGLPVYATPDAARSFNDDLDLVRQSGIKVVGEDEAQNLIHKTIHIELSDFNFSAIQESFRIYGVTLNDLSAVAVAVFDHGDSPPGYSDRQFRFDYLDNRIRAENRLSAFAYRSDEVPSIMTRLGAVVMSARNLGIPLVVMDTAPAAVLGATFDPKLMGQERLMVVNVGNFHTLAFRLGPDGIEGVFEHHTGLIDLAKLEHLLKSLASGTLNHVDVFDDHGHGALVYASQPLYIDEGNFGVAVTGPRRNMMRNSNLKPYFAVPFGDMMISGCFGLLAATGDIFPEYRDQIRESLRGAGGSGTPPWEIA